MRENDYPMGRGQEHHVQQVCEDALGSRQLRQRKEEAALLEKVRHRSYEKEGRLENHMNHGGMGGTVNRCAPWLMTQLSKLSVRFPTLSLSGPDRGHRTRGHASQPRMRLRSGIEAIP